MKSRPKKSILSRQILLALGIPTVFIPGLILASLLGWNWQEGLKTLKTSGGYQQSKVLFPESGVVAEVIDGDTLLLESGLTIRLLGIDAPARGQAGYQEAKTYLETLIDGEIIRLEYDRYQDDKYGRILAYVFENCRRSYGCRKGQRLINVVLVKEGYVKAQIYKDRAKLKYQDELLKVSVPE